MCEKNTLNFFLKKKNCKFDKSNGHKILKKVRNG